MECEYCKTIVKSKYNLKSHLLKNKTCLKSRGLQMESNFVCRGCKLSFTVNFNLSIHHETCRIYQNLLISEEYERKITELNDKHNREVYRILGHNKDLEDKHKNEINRTVKDLEDKYKNEINTRDRTIRDLQFQLDKMFSTIEKLAAQAIDKTTITTTTNNTNNNNSRNIYSDKYCLDNLTEEYITEKLQEHMTEQVFMLGQRGVAQICSAHLVKTPDDKVLIKCSDASRKKFKYNDDKGNIREDYDARIFTEKIIKPIMKVSKEVYDTIIENIEAEREKTEEDDHRKKSQLNDKSIKAFGCYAQIINIDNQNENSDFKNELAILTK